MPFSTSFINVAYLIISFLSTYTMTFMLKINTSAHPVSNSIFSLAIFVALFLLYRYVYKLLNKRLLLISGITGAIFSVFMIFGANLMNHGQTYIFKLSTWLNILFAIPLFTSLTVLLLTKLYKINSIKLFSKTDGFINRIFSGKKAFFVFWGLIFIAWVPALVASYPGIYGYDSVYQVGYYLDGIIPLSHPLIHTYLLGFCVVTLGNLFNSPQIGMLIYSLFQMLCLSAAFATCCIFIRKHKTNNWFLIICLLFFMFFPPNALLSFSSTKDVFFAAFFLLLILLIFAGIENSNLLNKLIYWAGLLIVVFMLAIFRNQGICVLLFGVIFAFVFQKRYWKQILALTLSFFALFALYLGPIATLCNGQKVKSVNEIMSIPCVQLSRALIDNENQLSESEIELIKEYVPDYLFYHKDPGISDLMKRSFDSERFKSNPTEFVKLWLSVGLKSPTAYVDAFARITIGLWYPDMNYRDPGAFHPYWEYKSTQQNEQNSWYIVDRSTPEFMHWLADFYNKITYDNSYQSLPVISMIFSSGIIIWILFLYIAMCIYYKKYKFLLPAMFVLGSWFTMLLGPVVLYRYLYPMVIVIPVFLFSAFRMGTDKD